MSEKMPLIKIDQPSMSTEGKSETLEHSLEQELSPEVIEEVMEKVQDINEAGTAYTVLGAFPQKYSLGILPKVLHEGVLGTSSMQGPWKEKWAEAARGRKNMCLCFNIVGRSVGFKKVSDDVENLEIKKSYRWQADSVGVIFDLAPFHEEAPHERGRAGKRNIKSFWNDWNEGDGMGEIWKKYFNGLEPGDPKILEHPDFERLRQHNIVDGKGMPISSTEFGFVLFPRVAPRHFKGLVLGRKLGGIKNYGGHGLVLEYPKEITSIMQEEDVLLPVYDENGNLLWPKPMWYKDVKKLVEERGKNKSKKNNDDNNK